jgi:hypothetical protein
MRWVVGDRAIQGASEAQFSGDELSEKPAGIAYLIDFRIAEIEPRYQACSKLSVPLVKL